MKIDDELKNIGLEEIFDNLLYKDITHILLRHINPVGMNNYHYIIMNNCDLYPYKISYGRTLILDINYINGKDYSELEKNLTNLIVKKRINKLNKI